MPQRARGENQASSQPGEPTWQEGAGSLLLLAAQETGLLHALESALPVSQAGGWCRLAHSTEASRRRLLLTLLFLGAVGLRRTWDLRAYTGAGLALLSGWERAYSYRHVERFLSEVAQAGGAEPLTDALAAWTTRLWKRATEDREESKYTRYCLEQCDLLRALAELEAKERAMYELKNEKDQCMTSLKLALANLGMWVRERWFPPSYAHATWHRLAPFFCLPGRVT